MDATWYIGREGQSFGPFSFDQLLHAARGGRLTTTDLVWQPSMLNWEPAGSIAELWTPAPLPQVITPVPIQIATGNDSQSARNLVDKAADTVVAGSAVSDETQEKSGKVAENSKPKSNFFLRHWRGELSLAVSYWVIGTLFTVAAIMAATAFGEIIAQAKFSPATAGAVLAVFLVAICSFTIWQLVGIWRSAGNHIRTTGRKFWATAARLAVILGVLRASVDFTQTIAPMLSATVQLATGVDQLPPYELRLLRDGRELELSGGMPFGTADAVRKFLDAAPSIEVVHLNSSGGRIGEGLQLIQLFRERGVATYTSVDCVSACTLAFLGGSKRFLSERARLGFHSASFGGLDQKKIPEINDEMRKALRLHGASESFVNKALAAGAESMWYPTAAELIDARIVTAVVDPANFAMSGIRDWRNPGGLDRGLQQVPYARALKQFNQPAYEKISSKLIEAVQKGKSEAELIADFKDVFTQEILPVYLTSSPDLALVRYWRSQIAEVRHLGNVDGQACLAQLNLVPSKSPVNLKKLVPPELLEEDMAALTAMIEAKHTSPPVAIVDSKELEADYAQILADVEKNLPGATQRIVDPAKHVDQPQLLCRSLVAFYDAALALPSHRAGRVLRALAAEF